MKQKYEQTHETMSMLKMLAQSEKDIEQGNVVTVEEAFSRLRKRRGIEGSARLCY